MDSAPLRDASEMGSIQMREGMHMVHGVEDASVVHTVIDASVCKMNHLDAFVL